MTKLKQTVNVAKGEFPYPLTDGPNESRYLTWVRNHSNYMAERGVPDYLRIVAVLARGILINFLTLLPYFLLIALALSFSVRHLKDVSGFYVKFVLIIAAVWVVFFPIVTRVFRVVRYQKTLTTGSSSSVKIRDHYERSFGFFLFAIIVVALIELFPFVLEGFSNFKNEGLTFPTIAGVVGMLVAANKLLPLLGGMMRKLAVLLVGALGLLIPFLVILFTADFLYNSEPYKGPLIFFLFLLPIGMGIGIGITTILGIRAFRARGFRELVSLIAAMLGLFVVAIILYFIIPTKYINEYIVFMWAVEIWVFCSLTVDVNLTSIHGLYRDRLASAFLVGENTDGDVDIEQDINLQDICNYDAGSTAPYHLVNVTLNLQGSKDISIRERNSDFFIFSKNFIGSERTGYCSSEYMEQVYPQIDLGTAMAISAAAASPNMGRGTNPLMVAFMTLLNARLGFWLPHPDRLQKHFMDPKYQVIDADYDASEVKNLDFHNNVFPAEFSEIKLRRQNVYETSEESPSTDSINLPTTKHNLVGIGFSGGGVRSATINLGIAQALHKHGVFDHIDYMSTVSGGGYLGSSISTLMRHKKIPVDENAAARDPKSEDKLLDESRASLMDMYKWRVRPSSLLREMVSMLDETDKWVNLSDGGHLENMAAIELLRRRCKYIIIGDGEADPKLHFNGLATLIRYARIDLGISIDINPDGIRVDNSQAVVDKGRDNLSPEHWAIGKITYPADKDREQETGYLLYLKSSFSGDEDEVIKEYRHRKPDFPHESTADQFFDENQFEAYRALGQHIAEKALEKAQEHPPQPLDKKLSFSQMEKWFTEGLWGK